MTHVLMSEAAYRAALVKIARLWRSDGDADVNRAANIAREALIATHPDTPRPTLAPLNALPDYDA